MSSLKTSGNSFALGLFLHSALDDSQLAPFEFRVYAHLCRRANDELRAWGSQKNIAGVCRMSVDSVGKALKSLEGLGLIERTEFTRDDGSRGADIIRLLAPTLPLTAGGVPAETGGGTRSNREGYPLKPRAEGNPLEGNPLEVKNIHTQISEPVLVSDSASAPSDVWEIPDTNFWEEMPDLSELETLASLEHQAETVFVPSEESSIKKIELEQKAQPDLKKVSGGAAELVDKSVDKSSARFNPRDVDLHESIPREAWLEWCQHRTEKRSPLTPIATKKQLAQLLEFAITGQTPQESIDHAISHSWQGFYLIRKARAGYVGKPQTTQEANERMVDSAASLYAACLKQDQERAAQRGLNA